MMRIIKKASIVLFFIMAFVSLRAEAATELGKFDWNPVMDAIIKVESRGNARAVNGRYVGVLQISPILVRECNNILKSRGQRKRFSLNDRFNPSQIARDVCFNSVCPQSGQQYREGHSFVEWWHSL